MKNGNMKLKECWEVNQITDMSVISFIKIIAKLNKSDKMVLYNEDKRLNERMSGFRVKMGFGLHVGWSIEVIFNFNLI